MSSAPILKYLSKASFVGLMHGTFLICSGEVECHSVKAAYNHGQHLDELKEMMQWWADYLDERKIELWWIMGGLQMFDFVSI